MGSLDRFPPGFSAARGVDEFLVVRLRHCHHLQEQGDAGDGTDAALENHRGFSLNKMKGERRSSTQFIYVYVVSVYIYIYNTQILHILFKHIENVIYIYIYLYDIYI